MSSTLLLPHAHSFVIGPAVINTHTEIDLKDEHDNGHRLDNGCVIKVEVEFGAIDLELFSFTYNFRELT